MTAKPQVNAPLPAISVSKLGGGTLTLGAQADGRDWQMVVVYRGQHCPLCKKYLGQLQALLGDFHDLGVGVVVVSGDPEDRARSFIDEIGLTAPVGYDLSTDQMARLGLYISAPRSAQETDRPFAEPGLFLVNPSGNLQIADISNAPFARPDPEALRDGLKFVRANDYPVRGTLAA